MGEGKANIFRFNIANFFDNVFKDCWLQRLILDFLHSAEMETLLNKIQVEIEVENNLNIVEKGLFLRHFVKNIDLPTVSIAKGFKTKALKSHFSVLFHKFLSPLVTCQLVKEMESS